MSHIQFVALRLIIIFFVVFPILKKDLSVCSSFFIVSFDSYRCRSECRSWLSVVVTLVAPTQCVSFCSLWSLLLGWAALLLRLIPTNLYLLPHCKNFMRRLMPTRTGKFRWQKYFSILATCVIICTSAFAQ